MKKKNKIDFNSLYLISNIGYAGITPIVIGFFLGRLIDKKVGTEGVFIIIFIILGSVAGILNMYRIADKYSKRK
ncbi:MAG: AtpZ/AtpI family protein [Tissierellia bacterium]|jgi:F0F1-type ATP synthase assembly protein I|nr:AtpZ/AtpI family protein [Tissierellia bacterium]MDD3226809.1 AtpZ/AtpI family protein [Tissierellia bacterium]MDD3752172.1 AtpZ/AtpI family protein [Tissierellia bacterium]MDD4046559.1 AtpZ/AtpI family protein [Tissierellia bacterium]MDD4678647.1 AtpZ/AtpI family protein [Tissierellia bacterium]